jgi:hypothetical protein
VTPANTTVKQPLPQFRKDNYFAVNYDAMIISRSTLYVKNKVLLSLLS